jgi:hypothetical protein
MDPIRPIGPRERDIEPVLRVPRPSDDDERERPEPREREPRRRPPEPGAPEPVPPTDPDEPPSLIDVRV